MSRIAQTATYSLLLVANAAANTLHSSKPADLNALIQEAYPVGNGRLGALPAGVPGADFVNINVDSLWYGGPLQNASYNGGNPAGPVYDALPAIRDDIFTNGQGNITALWADGGNSYGSYTPLGNLTVALAGVEDFSDYQRVLDLDSATHNVTFMSGGHSYQTLVFCSYPDNVCVYSISSSVSLPEVSITFQNSYLNSSATTLNYTCDEQSVRFQGTLSNPGMQFDSIARLTSRDDNGVQTSCSNNTLVVSGNTTQALTVVLGAGTNYDQTVQNFVGADPASYVESVTSAASQKTVEDLLTTHLLDYQPLINAFTLQLVDPGNAPPTETADLISSYSYETGDPYTESLLFDYGRYLLITSSRPNSLPANLQGRWAPDQYPAWSGDYHIDINLQMNYWLAS